MPTRSQSRSRSTDSEDKSNVEEVADMVEIMEATLTVQASPEVVLAADKLSLDSIVARQEAGEFPAVHPDEVEAIHAEHLSKALAWIKKDEYVLVQSYLNVQYSAYRESYPAQGDKAEAILHAEWARIFYYLHLNAWLSRHGSVKCDTFIPAVPPQLLPEGERAEAESLISRLFERGMDKDIMDFQNRTKERLASFLRVLPTCCRQETKDDAIDSFYNEKYYLTLSEYLTTRANSNFTPMVEVLDLPKSDQETLENVLPHLHQEDEKMCHDQITQLWEVAWDAMPTKGLQEKKEDSKREWLIENYIKLVAEYVSQKTHARNSPSHVFHPLVSLTDLRSEDDRTKAKGIIGRVEAKHADLIDAALKTKWDAFLKDIPSSVPVAAIKELQNSWRLEHYFSVIDEVIKREQASDTFTPKVSLEELVEGQVREDARTRLALMTPSLGETLEAKFQEKLRKEFQLLRFGSLEEAVKRHWTIANYYTVMVEVLEKVSVSTSSPTSSSTSPEPEVPLFFSPPTLKKRKRQSSEANVSSLTTRGVAECHCADLGLGYNNRGEFMVTYFAEELKLIDLSDKKTKKPIKVPLLTCLFADRTGVVQGDFWREKSRTAIDTITKVVSRISGADFVCN